MFNTLPKNVLEFMDWPWSHIEPYYQDLANRPMDEKTITRWLADWTRLGELLYETYQRLYVATTVDTTAAEAARRYDAFLDDIYPNSQAADQKLKEKLLASRLQPEGFAIPLRNIKAQADLFREQNLPLLAEELKLSNEYDKIIGAQTVEWEGKEVTIPQLQPVYQDPARPLRERAWRLAAERQLADRQAVSELWDKLLDVRVRIAENAGFPDYRAYRWQQLLRFDYTPEDSLRFHQAIEEVVVPAVERIYERRRHKLGVSTLRPWDLDVDPLSRPPLRPFQTVAELEEKTAVIFNRLDPQLGEYFEAMRRESLLDLDNRKGKAPGGYCTDFPVARRPFIFMNAVGIHDDVQTLLHEGGHAFHVFEAAHLPYIQQLEVPTEFAEVASTGMELLAAPYLSTAQDGFYSEAEAARARVETLEGLVRFWPYMAVVDAFQHWVYENPDEARNPENCDARWGELWQRFIRGVDWSGLDQELVTGWQRKGHIHQVPFYYIEYGLAQLGALQVWQNALVDQPAAVQAYRASLALGGTASLPDLFATAGAKFAFDVDTLHTAVELAERTIAELSEV